jgi:hypothetical protein
MQTVEELGYQEVRVDYRDDGTFIREYSNGVKTYKIVYRDGMYKFKFKLFEDGEIILSSETSVWVTSEEALFNKLINRMRG